MKKFILACGAALVLSAALTGCGKSAGSANDKTGIGDSLAMTFGALQGGQFLQYYNNLTPEEKAKINREALLKGMKETLFSDTTEQGYLMGQNIGINFLSEITQIERMSDVRVDRQKLYDAFAKAIMADSVTNQGELQAQMQRISTQVRERMQEFQKQQELNKPETQANIKAGKDYVDQQKKADSSIKTTESGLSYKVQTEGTGNKVSGNDKVKIKYTGKLTNGTVFDENTEGIEMNPAQLIPGFREGLQMMNKGSKYVFYIPGDLAYDVQGVPGKIGPMETLVFEVELLDIIPAETQTPHNQPTSISVPVAR